MAPNGSHVSLLPNHYPEFSAIDENVFAGNKTLRSVSGIGVTIIGVTDFVPNDTIRDAANIRAPSLPTFLNCTALESIDFPAAMTIAGRSFEGCSSLRAVNLPAATSIG